MAESTQTPTPAPFFHELKISKDAEEWLKTISPGLFQNYDQIQKTWNSPTAQFTLTLVQDAEFNQAVNQIRNAHLGSQFLSYELVLMLFLWIFRAWRLTKVQTWLTRIWTQAWIGTVFWLCALFLVPNFVWGESYRTILSHFFKAIVRHFFNP